MHKDSIKVKLTEMQSVSQYLNLIQEKVSNNVNVVIHFTGHDHAEASKS